MVLRSLALVFALLSYASLTLADVKFTKPKAGASILGGGSLSIEWEDSGDDPPLEDLSTYQLFLCAGGNTDVDIVQLTAITTQGDFALGNEAMGAIPAAMGGEGKNAYFLRMISVAKSGGTVTNYSPRFTLTGMTGTFAPNIIAALESVEGTKGPPTVNNVADVTASATPEEQYGVEYTMQTGLTHYAPMQKVPPTKIKKKSWSAQYPTSSVSFAKTFLPTPEPKTTFTQSNGFTHTSIENPASPAAMPEDDMQRWLNRWKD
ncbi:beta-1,6-glucan boisynthesis protein-like protein [Patellaria atrata CBS 101060]|uniref:Beta-1,6-glucan boisynthesis protein-like protein n=1 Tax=Patellaria atrata CBS 101060 TaxID=1346257 RepID=A0A9P4S516_9PEZI|nr:beta-1,6-glucan boisynthesis protein-like protein [Patellaria atrata CBS 101060]